MSFGGGQVEPATGDFVFGVSEGYLIEDGKVTAPVRGATLIGNGIDALAAIDGIAGDLADRDRLLRQGRPAGRRPASASPTSAYARSRWAARREHRRAAELEEIGRRAVEAALAAGADQAEAWVRALVGRFRSASTRARSRASARRARAASACGSSARRTAGLRLRHRPLSDAGVRRAGRARRADAARVDDAGRVRGPTRRSAARPTVDGLVGPGASPTGAPRSKVELRGRDRAGRPRPRGGQPGRGHRLRGLIRDAWRSQLGGLLPHFESTAAWTLRVRFRGRGRRPDDRAWASGSAADPATSIPRRSAPRPLTARSPCAARVSPTSRRCPVVLDAFVAASFAGFIGAMLSADAVQRGRSLFAGREGEEVAAAGVRAGRRRPRRRRACERAVRRRGLGPAPDAADRRAGICAPSSSTRARARKAERDEHRQREPRSYRTPPVGGRRRT